MLIRWRDYLQLTITHLKYPQEDHLYDHEYVSDNVALNGIEDRDTNMLKRTVVEWKSRCYMIYESGSTRKMKGLVSCKLWIGVSQIYHNKPKPTTEKLIPINLLNNRGGYSNHISCTKVNKNVDRTP